MWDFMGCLPVYGQYGTEEGAVLRLFGDEVDVVFHGRPLTQSPGRRRRHSGESRFHVHVNLITYASIPTITLLN